MFKAFVLVRNLKPLTGSLNFSDFTISPIGLRSKDLREVFSYANVNPDDWVLEKSYSQLPLGPPGSLDGGIPDDIEDILLLLRLYSVGDISFIRLAIIRPDGTRVVASPYPAMNDLNDFPRLRFEFQSGEEGSWEAFAKGVRDSKSWGSDWFAVARRFFLIGGAKQMRPERDDVDRIVDYTVALEATLVPERGASASRIRYRAAALVASDDSAERKRLVRIIHMLYELRSRIVHGSRLNDKNRQWLTDNWHQVEDDVRQVLVAAIRRLPSEEVERCEVLIDLYDPTDKDRGIYAVAKFREIKTKEARRETAAEIASEIEKGS